MKKIFILVFVLFLIGAGVLAYFVFWSGQEPSIPTPLDTFAKCLGEKEVTFYGAFWCAHCQNQKKLFGSSAKYLPYVECSLPSGQGQTQICADKKIEGYPTWLFPKEITVDSANNPVICEIQPGPSSQPEICAQVGSKYFKTWSFSDVKVSADKDPAHTGTLWIFPAGSRTSGELSIEKLSKLSGCEAPK
jgi:hypothetical protein